MLEGLDGTWKIAALLEGCALTVPSFRAFRVLRNSTRVGVQCKIQLLRLLKLISSYYPSGRVKPRGIMLCRVGKCAEGFVVSPVLQKVVAAEKMLCSRCSKARYFI